MRALLLLVALVACRGDDDTGTAPADHDGDGVTADLDCDDSDATVHPNAPELCDGLDNDCDATPDDGVLGSGPACAAETCADLLYAEPDTPDGVYYVDPHADGAFAAYCDMTVDGGGWTSLVHVSDPTRLRFDIPHEEMAVSTLGWFWILGERADATYTFSANGGRPYNLVDADAAHPSNTGWTWNGVAFPNASPEVCHGNQSLSIAADMTEYPLHHGNPSLNTGHAIPADVMAAAYIVSDVPDGVARTAWAGLHVGCVGNNVLTDGIVWLR